MTLEKNVSEESYTFQIKPQKQLKTLACSPGATHPPSPPTHVGLVCEAHIFSSKKYQALTRSTVGRTRVDPWTLAHFQFPTNNLFLNFL